MPETNIHWETDYWFNRFYTRTEGTTIRKQDDYAYEDERIITGVETNLDSNDTKTLPIHTRMICSHRYKYTNYQTIQSLK